MSKTSEQTPEVNDVTLEDVKELQSLAKVELSEARTSLRKFKKANTVRKAENIKDEKVKAEFEALSEAVEKAQKAYDTLVEQAKGLKPKKGSGGGGAKYAYPKITDHKTGEERELTKEEKKRWRTKARKEAVKLDVSPEEVPFDPNFLMPKPVVEKKKKEKVESKESEEDGEEIIPETPVTERVSRRNKNRKSPQESPEEEASEDIVDDE